MRAEGWLGSARWEQGSQSHRLGLNPTSFHYCVTL